MEENEKLNKGDEVILYIPFSYTIGEENSITGKVLETIEDCKQAIRDEIEKGISDPYIVFDEVVEFE